MGEKQKVMLPNRKDNRGQQQPGRIKQAVANAHFHDGDSAETIWEPHRELTATFGVSREHSGRIERLGMIGVWETPTPDFRVILDQTTNYRYGSRMRSCLNAGFLKPTNYVSYPSCCPGSHFSSSSTATL